MRSIYLSTSLVLFLGSPVFAAPLTDGTYQAIFAGGGCGKLVVANKAKKFDYSFGPCGGSPTFRSPGTYDGKTLKIKAARFVVSGATATSISGRWTLGSYSTNLVFKKS